MNRSYLYNFNACLSLSEKKGSKTVHRKESKLILIYGAVCFQWILLVKDERKKKKTLHFSASFIQPKSVLLEKIKQNQCLLTSFWFKHRKKEENKKWPSHSVYNLVIVFSLRVRRNFVCGFFFDDSEKISDEYTWTILPSMESHLSEDNKKN